MVFFCIFIAQVHGLLNKLDGSCKHSAPLKINNLFQGQRWMWSQMPGTKSEGVAVMYCLASSIYYHNMHPIASHEKHLQLLLSQTLLLTLLIHSQTMLKNLILAKHLVSVILSVVTNKVPIHCFIPVTRTFTVLPNEKFRISIGTFIFVYIYINPQICLYLESSQVDLQGQYLPNLDYCRLML